MGVERVRREHARAGRGVAAAIVIALLAGALGLVAGAAPATAAGTAVTLATFRDLVVDPVRGDVLVSGDDKVAVFSADGIYQRAIPNLPGAGGMDIIGNSLWVAETSASAIAEIDLTTRTLTRTIAVGVPITGSSLVAVGSHLWFASGPTLHRLDPATSTTTARGDVVLDELERVGSSTATLLTHDTLGGRVRRIDITTDPATVAPITSPPVSGVIRQIAVDPARGTYIPAAAFSQTMPEVAVATMTGTGVEYPAWSGPVAVAYTPGKGGLVVGGLGGNRVVVAKAGSPGAALNVFLPSEVVPRAVGASIDGTKVYALTEWFLGTKQLVTVPTAPTVTAVGPTSVVSGVPTDVRLEGTNLGEVTAATVGGIPATVQYNRIEDVGLRLPAGLPIGPATIQVTTVLGSVSVGITVTANTGATLSGMVTRDQAPVAGVQLALDRGPLAAPLTTTTAADGRFAFTGRAYGTDYRLVAHDPTGVSADQAVNGISLIPNTTTTQDLALAPNEVGAGAILARMLVTGDPRDLLVEPSTNRAFFSLGDQVLVLDHDGQELARINGMAGADGLARDGDDVYVNLRTAGAIARIDAPTLAVTGTWPTQRTTSGGLGFAGGRVWFSNGNGYSGVGLSSLDPTTGTIVDTPADLTQPRFRPVEGDPDLLFVWAAGITPHRGWLYDVSAATGTLLRSGDDVGPGSAVSATHNRIWTPSGCEWALDTFTFVGCPYVGRSSINPVAHSTARGGLLALDDIVAEVGNATPTHTLPFDAEVKAFDAGADRLFYAHNGEIVLWDLKAHLTVVDPKPVYRDLTSIDLSGDNLATTTSVAIDGASRSFTFGFFGRLVVDTTGLAAGPHTITATTGWGTSAPLHIIVFDRPPPPKVTSVSPTAVPTKGGTVTIKGSAFTGATVVLFGSESAVSYTVVNDTTITAVAPASMPGTRSITVFNAWGKNDTSPMLEWFAPMPTIASVSPASGSPRGGDLVTIEGSGFTFADIVTVDGVPLENFDLSSDRTISFRTPEHLPGTVTIRVRTLGGWAQGSFTYDPINPVITAVSPDQGLPGGGYPVLLTGSNLHGATSVRFGSTEAQAFVEIDDSSILATAPAGTAGAVTITVTTPLGISQTSPAFTYLTPGAAFHGITPTRVLDSRTATGGWPGKLADQPRALAVAGVNGIPADVTAVVANLTVTDPDAESFLTAYPTGTARPNASNLNMGAGQTIANLATIRVGTNGSITLANAAGGTHVVVDIVGWYRPGPGELFTGVTPGRVLDSRVGTGWSGRLGPGSANVRTLGLGLPATATSVVLNLTVTDGTDASFVQVWPTGASRPSTSNVNVGAGAIASNLATVKLGTGSSLSFFNAAGSINVIADVVGYYDTSSGDLFHPLPGPRRFLDSRSGVGAAGTWGPGQTRTVGIGADHGVPDGATAVVFNATVTGGTSLSFLTLFPPAASLPATSNLNFAPGQTVANLAVVGIAPTDEVAIANNQGRVHVIGDAVGYFAPN